MRVHEKVALVTGATSGIGRAIAILLAKEGAKVGLVGRSRSRGQEVELLIREAGGQATFIQADVSRELELQRAFAVTAERWGGLDILVNNAGIVGPIKEIVDIEEQEWDTLMAVNLKGILLGMKQGIPLLIRRGKGSVINISSEYGNVGVPLYGAYCASKAAVISLTKTAAVEYAPYGVRVNCICPGATLTSMQEYEAAVRLGEDKAHEFFEEFAGKIPLGRMATPEEVAQTALFLSCEESSYVTGSILSVDGGGSIWNFVKPSAARAP